MKTQGHTIPGGTSVSFTHTYNSARELSSTGSTAAAYLADAGTSSTTGYTVNGLNQYTNVGGVPLQNDDDGNPRVKPEDKPEERRRVRIRL
jgi:hypothetical protein